VDGLLIPGSIAHKESLDLAIKHRLPALTSILLGPSLRALMSYGSDYFALARQSALYVDKILKGAKPADLPVAFPTKFVLIVNLKTAKALGIEVSPMLLARANSEPSTHIEPRYCSRSDCPLLRRPGAGRKPASA
jgi:putative ABC transport system substrate-binding protein